jgi:hypothetical protein
LLADGRGWDIHPTTVKELVAGLRAFDAKFRAEREPRIAVLFADQDEEDTPRLSIGLGAKECMLAFDESIKEGVGACSKGSRVGDQTEVGFCYGTGYSQFLASTLIPKKLAIAAAREFFRTGRRPTNVEWDA